VRNLARGGRTRKSSPFLVAGNTLKSQRGILIGTTKKLMRGKALPRASGIEGKAPREGKAHEGC